MPARTASFPVNDTDLIKRRMLDWCDQFNISVFMDTHHYRHTSHSYECLCAVDAKQIFHSVPDQVNEWVFGHMDFETGYSFFGLKPDHHAESFDTPGYFIPSTVCYIQDDQLIIETDHDPNNIYHSIITTAVQRSSFEKIVVGPVISKEEYTHAVQRLREHILRGDCYEINFCQEFFGHGILRPVAAYKRLVALSPTPFSCFYKWNDQYLLCASPERFFKIEDRTIISEPIKGTIRRNIEDADKDEALKQELINSEKDQAENVMIVDLVRNDLSRICKEGSVHATELFSIHSFPTVHQMISTVKGTLREEISFQQVIKALFPMGSMTGAPKKKVLELTNSYEASARGIYSGTVGYIDPKGNADMNVVIRSIVYNSTTQKASYHVGGGITFYSDPEQEYAECLLKAAAMQSVLENA